MTIGELAQALGATVEQTLRCLYTAVREDPVESTITRITPGCTNDDLADAEQRISHS
jgi:hypothetical protein